MISFTQQNEQEADRIGIQVCNARDSIRRRCQPSSKNYSIGALLLAPAGNFIDSPVAGKCLADARNRANQMRPMVVQSSKISIWRKRAHWGCIIPDVTSHQ